MSSLDHWQKREYAGMNPGLSRIRRFLKASGNPQTAYPAVHIAGTNGKGSTAAMIASVLSNAGYRTGLYTSPHLISLTERVQIDGKPVPHSELERLSKKYSHRAQNDGLTFFEFITALAFLYFREKKIDIAVLETGLGGRFDATNVVKPLVSVITDIDYDHERFLGRTLASIAAEKAGIIKNGSEVVSGVERKAARDVIIRTSKIKSARLSEYGKDFEARPESVRWDRRTQVIAYSGTGKIGVEMGLLGRHQVKNAAIALSALEVLGRKGFRLTDKNIQRGMRNVTWRGRFEVLRTPDGRTIVLDGAHNPGGMKTFVRTLKESPWGKKKQECLFGVMGDKKFAEMVAELAPQVKEVVLVAPGSGRAAGTRVLRKEWEKHLPGNKIREAGDIRGALRSLTGKIVMVTGSLYLAGEVLRTIRPARTGAY